MLRGPVELQNPCTGGGGGGGGYFLKECRGEIANRAGNGNMLLFRVLEKGLEIGYRFKREF